MKNKVLTALMSFFIALGLWLYVVTVVSPNSDKIYYNIPVSMQNESLLQDRGLMITDMDVSTVSLHLEGNRTDLNKLNSSNISIDVDASKIYEAGTHSLSYSITYPGDIPGTAITVLSQNPSTVTVVVAERVSKSVPVEIQYTGTLSEDYMADKENKLLDYESVTVTGPKDVIDSIAMAYIQVDLEGRSESISGQFVYTLCNEKGEPVDVALVTTDVEMVNLTLRILRVKEIALELNVVEGGGATTENTDITIDPPTILISGSDGLLEDLDRLELGTVDLSQMLEDQTLTFPIKLPEGITNETGVAEATVNISFADLGTKTLTVTNINAINVPEGLEANLITKLLEVQIRGPKKIIDAVTAEDITVTVDFSEEQVGTVTVKAEFSISVDGVGAVGTYNVTAKLQEKK